MCQRFKTFGSAHPGASISCHSVRFSKSGPDPGITTCFCWTINSLNFNAFDSYVLSLPSLSPLSLCRRWKILYTQPKSAFPKAISLTASFGFIHPKWFVHQLWSPFYLYTILIHSMVKVLRTELKACVRSLRYVLTVMEYLSTTKQSQRLI